MECLKISHIPTFDPTEAMKYIYTLLLFASCIRIGFAQETGTPTAAFDVIIKINGDILYGKVVEVTTDMVKYKRTDIPDGPIYHLPKSEVYAISYRNQLKEILQPDAFRAQEPSPLLSAEALAPIEDAEPSLSPLLERENLQKGEVRLGFGFIPGYSKISNRDSYTTRAGFPATAITYLIPYRSSLMVGLHVMAGTWRYSRSDFDDYDNVRTEIEYKENLLTFAAVGKYQFSAQALRPYVLGGLAFHISSVDAESRLTFVEDDRELYVKSGVRNSGLGLIARLGLEYELNNQIGFYGDIGSGISLLQFGAIYKLNR
jgi:hypothetical protein